MNTTNLGGITAPEGANGDHRPDPASCKTSDRGQESNVQTHQGNLMYLEFKNELFGRGGINWNISKKGRKV